MQDVYVEGYSREVDHCPFCGGETDIYCADGSNRCADCDKRFYVIERET